VAALPPGLLFRIRIFCSRGSLTPVAAPNVSPNVFFEEMTGCVEADADPCFEGCGLRPSVETGASVPGYSGGFAAWVVVSDSDFL
jgi:hypothetical protein